MNRLQMAGAGLVTPLGFNYQSSCAAMRAGISASKEVNICDFNSGELINGCRVPLPQWWQGRGKLVDLVAPAIWECFQCIPNIPMEKVPILLGVPTVERPFAVEGIHSSLLDDIERKLSIKHNRHSQTMPHGRVAGFTSLRLASELIADDVPYCIVAGVDSFVHQELGHWLIDNQRILTESNSDGFIPGEAGSAVLVRADQSTREDRFLIHGIGFGQEQGTIESDLPLSGDGMTQAVKEAMNNGGLSYFDVDYRMTDLNGEHYKFFEAQIVEGRVGRKFDEHGVNRDKYREMWHPIEFVGDIGAAIGPLLLAWAFHAATNNYAPGRCVLFHVSNDDSRRAAVVARYGS